jgi:hypothetical protein
MLAGASMSLKQTGDIPGKIGLDDLVPLVNGSVEDTVVGSLAGVGDEDIDLAEVGNDVLDELLARRVLVDLALVGLDLDAVLLAHLLGVLLSSLRAGVVGDGNIGTELSASTGSLSTNAGSTGSTGDDDDLALQVEEVLELGCFGNGDRHCDGWSGV